MRQRWARMTGFALANLDRVKARRGAGFVVPYADNLGPPARLERPPDLRGTGNALEQPGLIDGLVLRGAGEDRIVPVENRLHVDEGSILGVVGGVAHPLAEPAFRPDLGGQAFAFDREFPSGR